MARTLNRLTARTVVTATKVGIYSDGGGLYLRVQPTAKSWVFIDRKGGKRREVGLGSAATVALAEARAKADECRKAVNAGRDPRPQRAQRVPTFGELADEYIAAHRTSWKNEKHAAQWEMTLREYAAPIRNEPVNEITVEDVLKCLKPLWQATPETAGRLRGRIEMVLDMAKARRFRDGENPAAWKGNLKHLLPVRPKLSRGHHGALPWREMAGFVEKVRAMETIGALALEFTILTAVRSGEALGARWDEIDLEAKVWTIPAARMKAGVEHRVPLSNRALAILAAVAPFHTGDHVFPGQRPARPLSAMALEMVLRRLDAKPATVHGFRSAFRDWAGEATSFPREVAEAALAHAVGDEVERAYRRGDALERRRELMAAWAQFCEAKERANVVPLRKPA